VSGPIIHGGGITEAARIYGGRPGDWLDLSTGINPNPVTLPDIPIAAWHRLPDQHLVMAAREAARGFYRSGAALPLAVPGTQAYIQILPRLLPAGRRVAILSPTYGEYAHSLSAAGFDVDEITDLSMLSTDHGGLVIANPNNPDGRVLAPESLMLLADRMAGQGGLLLVDEAFGDSRPELSVAARAHDHPGLIVSRSFGKFFGLAGLRLGFVIAPAAVLETIESAMGPWPVSGPALHLASRILPADRAPITRALRERSTALRTVLEGAGLDIAGGTDLFCLVRHADAAAIFDRLARAQILVRKFAYAPDWLRFGLAPDEAGDVRLSGALA
jgi:cobalamin biosynthetic protein CobC